MEQVKTFEELIARLGASGSRTVIAVANPVDECTHHAIADALSRGIAKFVLVGGPTLSQSLPDEIRNSENVTLVETTDEDVDAICRKAVETVRNGDADVLMKGLVNTDNYLRAILNKEHGLLPAGNLLTHLTAAQLPGYHKMLFFSDVAVIPYPTLEQKEGILRCDLATLRKLGISEPKVALIHFTEKVNPKFPNSVDYTKIIADAEAGKYGDAKISGPMDVKTACDLHSAQVKGIKSDVCGNADLLLFPNIESGNTFYKAITLFGGALIAGIIQGAMCPVILPSRSDSSASKLASIVLACASARK